MAYHYQARDMAVLHAVANARPFAQSARGGLSYIIDQNGHYVAQTRERGYDFLEGTIQVNKAKTLYTIWGDWVVWISVSIVLGAWLTSLAPMRKYWVRHSRKQ
jgi:apolipoprotein N-acyltransferase